MEALRSSVCSYIPLAVEKCCTVGGVGVSAIGCKLFHATLVVFFAIVGITIGAIAGASIGLKTRCGVLHGATVGAIIGSVFSTSVFGAYTTQLDPDDASYGWILPWVDSTAILAAKIVHDYYMRMLENPGKGRQARNLVDKLDDIPRIKLTDENLVDSSGNRVSCAICLQDMECAQVTRTLPQCQHLFHADCVDRWFSYQRSCPLCRCIVIK